MIPFENEVRIACAVLMEKYKPEKIVMECMRIMDRILLIVGQTG